MTSSLMSPINFIMRIDNLIEKIREIELLFQSLKPRIHFLRANILKNLDDLIATIIDTITKVATLCELIVQKRVLHLIKIEVINEVLSLSEKLIDIIFKVMDLNLNEK